MAYVLSFPGRAFHAPAHDSYGSRVPNDDVRGSSAIPWHRAGVRAPVESRVVRQIGRRRSFCGKPSTAVIRCSKASRVGACAARSVSWPRVGSDREGGVHGARWWAARDHADKQPAFAIGAGLLALSWPRRDPDRRAGRPDPPGDSGHREGLDPIGRAAGESARKRRPPGSQVSRSPRGPGRFHRRIPEAAGSQRPSGRVKISRAPAVDSAQIRPPWASTIPLAM